jgi:hypothetical protein
MVAATFSETSVNMYQTTMRNIRRRENLKSCQAKWRVILDNVVAYVIYTFPVSTRTQYSSQWEDFYFSEMMVKFLPCLNTVPCRPVEELEVKLHAFSTSAAGGDEWLDSGLVRFITGKRDPGAQRRLDRLRASLHSAAIRTLHLPAIEPRPSISIPGSASSFANVPFSFSDDHHFVITLRSNWMGKN